MALPLGSGLIRLEKGPLMSDEYYLTESGEYHLRAVPPEQMKKAFDGAIKIVMATEATHDEGDCSREEEDFAAIYSETDTHYIGRWMAGFPWPNTQFPKETCRELSWVEKQFLTEHWVFCQHFVRHENVAVDGYLHGARLIPEKDETHP